MTLERDEDVQKSREQNVLLDDVRVEAKARPVQADVEIAVACFFPLKSGFCVLRFLEAPIFHSAIPYPR